MQHAAISTFGDPFELETVCASDPLAARLDEMQLDFGEGLCWEARTTRTAVLVRDLLIESPDWPVLRASIASHHIRSAYAFPLSVGSLDIGAVDLYATGPDALTEHHVAEATRLARVAALHVVHRAVSHLDGPPEQRPFPRQVVHQATGMVMAQLSVSADHALLVIRGHAFAQDRPVHDVATDIVAHRITVAL